LFCFVLFCFALFCFALLCFVLLCFVSLFCCFALLCFALFCFVLFFYSGLLFFALFLSGSILCRKPSETPSGCLENELFVAFPTDDRGEIEADGIASSFETGLVLLLSFLGFPSVLVLDA